MDVEGRGGRAAAAKTGGQSVRCMEGSGSTLFRAASCLFR